MAARLPGPLQLADLGRAVGRHFDEPLLRDDGFVDWSRFFDWLGRRSDRFLLVLDEFPYLVEADPAVPSLWQRGWDQALARTRACVVLMGSSVSMMERETLAERSPLYGRRTGQLRLQPFGFRDAARFLPRFSFEDQVRAYSMLGGIPYYLTRFDDARPLAHNLRTALLEPGAVLRDEVEFLLREELQEPRVYFAVMQAIAQGKRRSSEIANAVALPYSSLGKYLGVLQSLDLVRREVPVTEAVPEKSKRGLYAIVDPYVAFWFRHVFSRRSLLEVGRTAEAAAEISAELDLWASAAYEEICRQEVRRGLLDDPAGVRWAAVGRWWEPGHELDLVAYDAGRGCLLVAECKWSRRPVGLDVLAQLERAAEPLCRSFPGARVLRALFSRAGFTADLVRRAAGDPDLVLVRGLSLSPGAAARPPGAGPSEARERPVPYGARPRRRRRSA
ncbi:MAG: ATP-binding protein [Deltaproteobacteria bacterium]|nr:ATP-binding protein [Deltaproteobacteria bacterium]